MTACDLRTHKAEDHLSLVPEQVPRECHTGDATELAKPPRAGAIAQEAVPD